MKRIVLLFIALIALNNLTNAQEIDLKVGQTAPEINMDNPNGEKIALSSLKGKVVLIDFWASWCRPCRMENPFVVETYNKYKDSKFSVGEGFTVYSISLDNNRNYWTTAIEKDKLSWPYHVCDQKGWYSEAAQTYNIEQIPSNFLIDKNGVIIAKNLRGQALAQKLESLLAE